MTTFRRLRTLNVVVGAVMAAQAAVVLALSNDLRVPVSAAFLTTDPVSTTEPTPAHVVLRLPVGATVAVFLVLAAVDHLVVAAPRVHLWYEANLLRGRNVARWVEYSGAPP